MIKNKPSFLFYLLLIIFILPIVFAGYAFKHPACWIKHTTNHGRLIAPIKSLSDWPLSSAQIPTKWVLLLVNQGACDAGCAKDLYRLHQTQVATGKYQDKVAEVYIGVGVPLSASLQKKYPDLVAFTSDKKHFVNQHLSDRVFLVDPRGNIILAYTETNDPEDLYKDLMHLLEVN